jgi:lactoylglutathione lyase
MIMKKLWLCLILLSAFSVVQAQKQGATLDHIGMYVRNLDTSIAFYSSLLKLDSIPNPWKNFRVKWYTMGGHIQLHLIEGLKQPMDLPIMFHMSVSVTSLEDFMKELAKLSIPYYDGQGVLNKMNVRGDGVKQILIKDPDGYWVEINNAVH